MKIKELINALENLDGDIPVVILDADEGTTLLNIQEIIVDAEYVSLAGYYTNIFDHI